ncbi:hypothetical protein M8J77_013182 [Diaphorina citri]|nr:hypothetical protein M8J77_013182 [Diaphorina citri]
MLVALVRQTLLSFILDIIIFIMHIKHRYIVVGLDLLMNITEGRESMMEIHIRSINKTVPAQDRKNSPALISAGPAVVTSLVVLVKEVEYEQDEKEENEGDDEEEEEKKMKRNHEKELCM